MKRLALLAALLCSLLAPATGGSLAWERCQARIVAVVAQEPASGPTAQPGAARRPARPEAGLRLPVGRVRLDRVGRPAAARAPHRVARLFLLHRSLLR